MKTILYYFSIIIPFLTSCRYKPEGVNFIELKPPDDFIPINISLNNTNPLDTVYVFQETKIKIKINATKDLKEAIILFDGKKYRTLHNTYELTIHPDKMEEGTYPLTVTAVFTSGTGSLAEILGMEGYMGELSWNISILHISESQFEVGYCINNEGFLEIFWDNAVKEYFIEKYIINSKSRFSETNITLDYPKQKSLIDYSYVCGEARYEVQTYLKFGYSNKQKISFDKPLPSIYFEDLGLEQLRVFWDKPFANGQFSLFVNGEKIASGFNDTSINVSQYFGSIRNFGLDTRPQKKEYENSQNPLKSSGSYCMGINLELPNFPDYSYSKKENIIYTTKYNDLLALDATTFIKKNSITINGIVWGLLYGGKLACAHHNSTIAAMTGEETWIFPDSRFKNPVKIKDVGGHRITTRLSALTSDDRFFTVERYTNICKIFDVKTGSKIFDFQFKYATPYDSPTFVTVSDDGRYFCASSENGMEVFEINGTSTNLIYTDTRHYKGAFFVPFQPDKLLLRVDSDIELRQIPDFSLVQSFNMGASGAFICNIDPVTGYFLYHQDNFLKIAKTDNITNPILVVRSDDRQSKLLNNKIITMDKSIVLDISPFLK